MMELFHLLGRITIENADANENIDETVDRSEDAEKDIIDSFKKIGAAVVTYFTVDKIVSFGKTITETAAEIQASNAQFEAAFGNMAEDAQSAFDRVGSASGILSTRLQTEGTKAFSMFKGAGMDANEALEEMESFLALAADAAAYYDISLEEASARVLGFAKGNYENGDAIGVFTNETQRNSIAMEQYGKKFSECTEAQKQMMALDMIQHTYEMSGALGQATRESEGYENVTGNLAEANRQLQAVLGTPLLQNIVIPAVQFLTGAVIALTSGFQEASVWAAEHETVLAVLGVGVGTVTALIIAYNVQQALATSGTSLWAVVSGTATAATTALGAAFTFLTSPIGLVIVAIGAVVAAGVALYKNWDEVKVKATQLWEKVSSVFENIKTTVSDKINAARDSVHNAIEKIKGFFNFDWSLPRIKLPHVSISGEFSLAPPSVPRFGIEWYAKAMDQGMILDKPTIFGYDIKSGKFLGGGETGSETVVGTGNLMGMIRAAVAEQDTVMISVLYDILEALLALKEDLPEHLRDALDGVALELNNREFGRLVRAVR